MPLYEYHCAECGARFEQLRRMSEADNPLVCPKCKSERVSRQLSTFASKIDGGLAPCGRPSSSCSSSSRFT
ncbi:MAG: FmdB family zinc ribbon protein [bacterium]